MLARCVEACPEELWATPNPIVAPAAHLDNPEWNGVERPFWRIAFHDVYFTHLYLGQDDDAFQPPIGLAVYERPDFSRMWQKPWDLEPYELPAGTEASDQSDILEYIRYVDRILDSTVDGLDLDSQESGLPWYKNVTKLSHELMTLRHLQGHVGQLSELLMQSGIDIDWS